MREVTKEMIRVFNLKKLGYDFMGYTFKRPEDLSFHHLVIAHKDCKQMGLGEGYLFWNGAILTQRTAHEYLHTIEKVDPDMFRTITSEMIDENILRKIELANLRRIRDVLLQFEKEYSGKTTKKNNYIIKDEYVNRRIKL